MKEYSADLIVRTSNSVYEIDTTFKMMHRSNGLYQPLHDWHENWFEYRSISPGYHNNILVVPEDEEKVPFITSSIKSPTALEIVRRANDGLDS